MTNTILDIREILRLIPHRWPFVMIDRVTDWVEGGETLKAIKNVTYNEAHFPGHFPAVPTMPGVLVIEAMAQACGILAVKRAGLSAASGQILYFAGIDSARFKRPVVPGDQLVFDVRLHKQKRDLWKFVARATVDGELACEAELMCVLRGPVA
ncbi:MAG: 3-hydroxyacyl-ACP dehydratase FabZ [Nevskiaceae bacterium]